MPFPDAAARPRMTSNWPPPPPRTPPPPPPPGNAAGSSSAFEPGAWRWERVVWPIAVVLGSFAFAIALVIVLVPLMNDDLAGGLVIAAAGLAILLGGMWRRGRLLPDEAGRVMRRPSPWPATIGWGLLCGIGLLVTMVIVMAVGLAIDGSMADKLEDSQVELGLGLWPKVLAVVALVLFAPLGEELVFRGLLLRGLAARMGFWWAAALSSVVFGMAHLDVWFSGVWVRAVALVAVGLGLALIYRRWGYWASVTAHMVVNAVAATALLVQA